MKMVKPLLKKLKKQLMIKVIKKIKNKISYLRLLVIIYALLVISGAWPTDTARYFKGQEVGIFGRWALVAYGIVIFWCGIFYKRPVGGKHFTKLEESICPKCQQVFMPKKAPEDQMCHKCNCSLEQLEGFYKRHPELKKAEIDTSIEETKK
ncbi:hypothetical protein [Desulfovibrio gilichinskyi]|nr:hypothetical protein [Desulfovibrio gilichinskyi]